MKKKKFQSALLDPPGRYTGNNFLFKGGLNKPFCIFIAFNGWFDLKVSFDWCRKISDINRTITIKAAV